MTTLYVIGPRGVPNVEGGIEKFTSKLYPLLVPKSYKIKVLTLRRYTSDHTSEWKGLSIKAIPSLHHYKLEKLVYNFFAVLYCIYKRPDIIHIHSIASGTFVFMLRAFGLKVVCRYNSQDYLYPKWGWLARKILKFGEKNFFLANHIICNSRAYMELFKDKVPPGSLSFVPNGIDFVDDAECRVKQPIVLEGIDLKSEKYILTVGRITPEKGFDVLLSAFRQLDYKDLKLVIVGDYELSDSYTRQLCDIHSLDGVIFTGYLDQEKIIDVYCNSELYVSASRYEGMSNSVLEAIGCGCKVLLSDIAGNVQLPLADQCFFVSENIDDLTSMMKERIEEKGVPDYSALKDVYDWSKIAEQIDRINRSL